MLSVRHQQTACPLFIVLWCRIFASQRQVITKKSNNRYILLQILCVFKFLIHPTFQGFLFSKTPQDHKLNPKKWILETWGSGQLRQNAANSFRDIGSKKSYLPTVFCFVLIFCHLVTQKKITRFLQQVTKIQQDFLKFLLSSMTQPNLAKSSCG